MWTILVRLILRNRLGIIIAIGLLTAFMAYQALRIEITHEPQEMLPSNDSTSIIYKNFKTVFGEDGSVMFVGIQDKNIFNLAEFNDFTT